MQDPTHIALECQIQFHVKKGCLPRAELQKYIQRMIETSLNLDKQTSKLLTKLVMEIINNCCHNINALELYKTGITLAVNNLNGLQNKEKVIKILSSIPEDIGYDNDLHITFIDPSINPNVKKYIESEDYKNSLSINNANNKDSDDDIDFFMN